MNDFSSDEETREFACLPPMRPVIDTPLGELDRYDHGAELLESEALTKEQYTKFSDRLIRTFSDGAKAPGGWR